MTFTRLRFLYSSAILPKSRPRCLVSLANEVISQALNSRAGVARNLGLAVVADNNGLLGLGNGDTQSALDPRNRREEKVSNRA